MVLGWKSRAVSAALSFQDCEGDPESECATVCILASKMCFVSCNLGQIKNEEQIESSLPSAFLESRC